MILTSVYLYSNKIDVYTNSLDNPVIERYNRVYNRNLKIYRSADNRIEIRIKTGDQKSANIGESVPVFTLVASDTQRLIFRKDCVVRDHSQGVCYVDLTQHEVARLEKGNYQYNVTLETRNYLDSHDYQVDRTAPLYVDSQYGGIASIMVEGDLRGAVTASTVIERFSYVNPRSLGEPEMPFFISSVVDAQPFTTVPQTTHTFQFYFDNYKGRVEIQASLDYQGASPKNWTTVKTIDIDYEPLAYANVFGKFAWLRIKHSPSNEIYTLSSLPAEFTGSVDKVLYR